MRHWLLIALLVGCGGAQRSNLQVRLDQDDAQLSQAEADARLLSAQWDDVVFAFSRARDEYAAATAAYRQANALASTAATVSEDARARWESAARTWRFYQQLVIVAASLDAARLEGSGRPGARPSNWSCDENMSTAQYRARLRAEGVDLAGKDIDHIVPHALGGADNPANYEVISSSLNRSLQDTFDANKCFTIAGAPACAAAVAVSRECGSFRGQLPW